MTLGRFMLYKLLQRLLPVVETTYGKSFISIFAKVEETFFIGFPASVTKSFITC